MGYARGVDDSDVDEDDPDADAVGVGRLSRLADGERDGGRDDAGDGDGNAGAR